MPALTAMSNSRDTYRITIDGIWPSISCAAFAILVVLFSLSVQAGKITSIPSASGANGFGGLSLANIEVVLGSDYLADGDPLSTFNESSGVYSFSDGADYYGKLAIDTEFISLGTVEVKAGENTNVNF